MIRDCFWFEKPAILIQHNRLIEFFPVYDMSIIEKLNAIVRLSIYAGIILSLITNKTIYLYLPLIIMLFTIFIYKNTSHPDINETLSNKQPDIIPTVDNPLMNFNLITDPKTKPQAPISHNNSELKNNIENKFNNNLYRDVSDIYQKKNSQREFYTMPNTEAMNDQNGFANWLYKSGPTCKEQTINCAPGRTGTLVV
jgi:hypothetical protein